MSTSLSLPPMIVDQALRDATAELAATVGLSGDPILTRLCATGPSRLYRVDIGPERLLLKRYFPGSGNRQERLRRDFAFTRHLWSVGIRDILRPIAADYTRHMGLFDYVDTLAPAAAPSLRREDLPRFAAFLIRIQEGSNSLSAMTIPAAVGALESAQDPTQTLPPILRSLRERADAFEVDPAVRTLMDAQILPAWESVRTIAESLAPLPADRLLTPGDFGPHHALRLENGDWVFHGFDTAGWDDAANFVARLFAHPSSAAALSALPELVSSLQEALHLSPDFERRCLRLLPLRRLHTCCRLLDEMLPAASARPSRRPRRLRREADPWQLVRESVAMLHEHDLG